MLLSRAIYRGLLQRSASARVLAAKEIAIWSQGGPAAELDRVLHSHEFTVMVLPDLVAQASADWCGRHIFFLHVPKTAGTAFRLALTEAAGVPAIMTYPRRGTSLPEAMRRLPFWPLFAGHAHVDDFPSPHRGVTTLREPRSRLLSWFRQQQRDPRIGLHAHLIHDLDSRLAEWRSVLSMSFERWLKEKGRPQMLSFAAGTPWHEGQPWIPGDPASVRASLQQGLSRFDAAAWSHDPFGLQAAVTLVTGREHVNLDVANEFREHDHSKPVSISPEARMLLQELARADQPLFDIAHDLVGLPRLDGDEADRIFESTARRLGFTFA